MKPAKIRYSFTIFLFLLHWCAAGQNNYLLTINPVDKDAAFIQSLGLKNTFNNKDEALQYIQQIVPQLQAKGYVTASVDSIKTDTLQTVIALFTGQKYTWHNMKIDAQNIRWLRLSGFGAGDFSNQVLDYNVVYNMQQRLLNYFENNGYPFAKIYMDSLQIDGDLVSGKLNISTGPLYHIDSIKVTGNAKISNDYLQNFLEIKNGSVYNKEKLQNISAQLKKLNYVQEQFPPQVIWGSTGGTVELFLQQKKSSQVNLIIGFLPNTGEPGSRKLLITGEGLLNLKNALGAGETIGLIWQRLQASSQRLNIIYQQPYLFKTRFGIDFGFDMLKRDSAFLNFDFRLGTQYAIDNRQYAKLYAQRFSTIINTMNIDRVIATKTLPEEADVRVTNIGIEYGINTTNYIFNPVSGFDVMFNTAIGNKQIKPNNQLLELQDPNDPDFNFAALYDTVKTKSYQLKTILSAAKYFPIGKAARSTVKTAVKGGYLGGSNIFRNELFQIGGYRLLRGFDEQSQFLSQYTIGTLEYRYLVGENSYFNVFTDGGWGKNSSRGYNINYTYISGGMGLAFETKAGLFNLAWAVGKRNDTQFNLRQSKIHFGFINYF